jgi:hypothetical protein
MVETTERTSRTQRLKASEGRGGCKLAVQSDRKGQGSEDGRSVPMRARHGCSVLQSCRRTHGKKSLIEKAIGPAELILLTWTCLEAALICSVKIKKCVMCVGHTTLLARGGAGSRYLHVFMLYCTTSSCVD